MKKFIVTVITVISLIIATTVPAFAITPGEAASIVISGAKNVYEMHVISEMAGRCGAATQTGASGVAFEIMYKDKLNLTNFFKECSANLTKSANAVRNDIVVTNAAGQPTYFYQCKNVLSPDGIRKTFANMKSGKYSFTKLVGTTESAELYNEFASAQGSTSTMLDSGISANAANSIAEKALGNGLKLTNLKNAGIKTGTIGALIDGGVAIYESIINEDDINDLLANVTVKSAKGFVSGTGIGIIAEVAGCALSSKIATIILVCVAGKVVCYLVDSVINDDAAHEIIVNALATTEATIVKTPNAAEAIVTKTKYSILTAAINAKDSVVNVAERVKATF